MVIPNPTFGVADQEVRAERGRRKSIFEWRHVKAKRRQPVNTVHGNINFVRSKSCALLEFRATLHADIPKDLIATIINQHEVEKPITVDIPHNRLQILAKGHALFAIASNRRCEERRVFPIHPCASRLLIDLQIHLKEGSIRPDYASGKRPIEHQRVCPSRKFLCESIPITIRIAVLRNRIIAIPIQGLSSIGVTFGQCDNLKLYFRHSY